MVLAVDLVVVEVGSLANQIVPWLTDIVPELIVERKAVEFALLGHCWKDLLLDHAETLRNPVQNRHVEQVHSGIDLVADEVGWFLDEGVHPASRLRHYHSESAGVFHFCEDYRAFLLMRTVELQQFLKRKITDDIAVEHKK